MNNLKILSPVFTDHGPMPVKYSCKGENINPPLHIRDLPQDAVSLAIVVEDPDAPSGVFDHWVVWNIPPMDEIPEKLTKGVQGNNSKNKPGYTGPCPPSGTHRYAFKVYALDALLELPVGTNKKNLLDNMKDHILAAGELVGIFSKTALETA
jgi:Raf kinase inhibitor-like YbhB/YbcL family protein